MVVIRIKLHMTCPSDKNPMPDRPWVRAEANENPSETIPSNNKMWNRVTSVLKVSKTHFKLNVLQKTEAELRANIAQWKVLGNIDALSVRPLWPQKRVKEKATLEQETCCAIAAKHQKRSLRAIKRTKKAKRGSDFHTPALYCLHCLRALFLHTVGAKRFDPIAT